jgi:predicted 2-oxoglutarate/Fe(II)-dependent dioxygenase YbiX
VRTPEEREVTIHDPKSANMPGQLKVELKAGQTVFYDNNILHRASYVSSQKRATLHASMGTIEGGHYRASCILQHGLDWMQTDDFKNALVDSLRLPYNNLMRMAQQAGISQLHAAPIH